MAVYTLFYIGQARAPNIQTLLVTRFLSGFFSVAPLTNCGGKQFSPVCKLTGGKLNFLIGVIADIWSAVGRGPASILFGAGLFLGTVAGPIVSG
jgi:DHA1 family multidrug resistance protein-like MFS transporter